MKFVCLIFFWWVLSLVLCVWVQHIFPGVDCFAPLFILSLQERKYNYTLLLGTIGICIHEGTGVLAFGSSLLWYSGLLFFFLLLCQYLPRKSPLLLLLLSIFSGLWHWIILFTMTHLQEILFDPRELFVNSIHMALLFPLLWTIFFFWYAIRGKKGNVTQQNV